MGAISQLQSAEPLSVKKLYFFRCTVHSDFENILNFLINFINIEDVEIKITRSGSEFDIYFVNNSLFQ